MKKAYQSILPAIAAFTILCLAMNSMVGSVQTLNTKDKIILLSQAFQDRKDGKLKQAKQKLQQISDIEPADQNIRSLLLMINKEIEKRKVRQIQPQVSQEIPTENSEQHHKGINHTNPKYLKEYVKKSQEIKEQITIGETQFKAGDLNGAEETFALIETSDPNNPQAKQYLQKIAKIKQDRASQNRVQTKATFMQNVNEAWALPKVFDRESQKDSSEQTQLIERKLSSIKIPEIHFKGLGLDQVIETLINYSVQNDPTQQGIKGINIVLFDYSQTNPKVNITLRNLTLGRVLDYVVQSIGYDYDIKEDAVIITPGIGEKINISLQTEFFPISRSALIRMISLTHASSKAQDSSDDPFGSEITDSSDNDSGDNNEKALKAFFQRAGVPFNSVQGAHLALTGAQLIVTQTSKNLKKIENILKKFSEVKMVEIESKFLDVQQGDLEELGVDWAIKHGKFVFSTNHRSLQKTFGINTDTTSGLIRSPGEDDKKIPVSPPRNPSAIDLGPTNSKEDVDFSSGAGLKLNPGALGTYGGLGVAGGVGDVQAVIRALSRKEGNDLMSAPKITVLSENTATIVIAQELVYPESYSDIEAEVSTASDSGGQAVAITPGTPKDFTHRNVGVEMSVTPTVHEDHSISLRLKPTVTEFEGFVEYGSPSVAISGNTTVSIPAGFYQPIFSVRSVETEVTIWDGATVLLGGLTREQSLTVKDKVPFLGDLPLIGKLFSSSGETSQKRNLLIFVTANLVSPGGSPARQNVKNVSAGTVYTNPTIVTPGGIVHRTTEEKLK
jgi:general secretion pathway protein D